MNSSYQFTEKSEKTIQAAISTARDLANSQLAPLHIAKALLDDESGAAAVGGGGDSPATASLFANILQKAGADVQRIRKEVQRGLVRLPAQDPPPDDVTLSPATLKLLRKAQELQKANNDTHISQDTLVLALSSDSVVGPLLKQAGADEEKIKAAVAAVRQGKKVEGKTAEEGYEALSKYAVDMTALAREGKLDPVIGRQDEIRRVIRILCRRTKSNPCLIGDPGVGKTAVLEGLAQRIVNRDVPPSLIGKLYSLDMGALMAGAKYRGEYEERIKSVLDEIKKSEEPIILAIDEMHLLMAGKDGGGMDAANLIKPMLARGELHCIGATTLNEYRKYIEKDNALERRFQQVLVKEPTVPEAISILSGLREKYEAHHGVDIPSSSIVAACTLAARYLTSRRLPDSAIDLIDEAASAVKVARETRPEAIDQLERTKIQLEVEAHALKREKEQSSKDRLKEAQAQISRIDDELSPLMAKYQADKARGDEIQNLRQKIDAMNAKSEDALRRRDFALYSDLSQSAIPDAKARLRELEAQKQADDARRGETGSTSKDAVTPDAIAAVVARWTGIPASRLQTTEKQRLLKMEKHLRQNVVGQPEAVQAVSNAIRLSRSGLGDPNRPIASFLFAGPSGTGKTLLTKELAAFLFDSEQAICRIDASEFSEDHSVSRLIGAPPGYVGYDEGGVLTEYVRRRPYTVVLLDEIEKASKKFLQIFLQVLDDGRLTDGQGRVVDFKNTVIIMTSNLGAQYLNAVEDDMPVTPAVHELVMGAIRSHMPPEFINRISQVVIFNRLQRSEVRNIVDIRLKEIQKRIESNGKNIKLAVDSAAKDWLAAIGYNPQYGARPLNRALQSELLNPLARYLIDESIRDGETAHITLDAPGNRLHIQPNHQPSFSMDADDDDNDDDMIEVEELD